MKKEGEQLYGCNHSPPLSLNQINHRERKRERKREREIKI